MPTFQYEAMDHTGREVKDSIDAATQEEAQQLIRQKGFFVTKIAEKAKKAKTRASAKKGGRRRKKAFTIGKISTKQLCTFTRQLSTLQDAGLPILRSLKILEGQCKPGVLKNALQDIVEDIESGQTLSEACAKHPKAFDRLYCNMIKAGEAGGALEAILQRLADFKEKSQSLEAADQVGHGLPGRGHLRRLRDRRLHPLLHHPQVRGDLQRLQLPLPKMTIFLIDASHFLIKYFYVVFLTPLFIWIFIKLLYRNKTGAYICDRIKLMIPVMGTIVEKSTVARTMRTLGTLVQSGVPILESLNIVRDTAGNAVFERAFTADLREHPRGRDDRPALEGGPDRRRHRGQHDRRRRGDRRARYHAQQDRRQLR